ncbi:CHAT domain-containing protein [Nostoc sp.]|uniref:WD40 domain-containing protein n=1 Tax=Nostoc sp. TaxID=1180 RepID=UPI002FFCC550
MKRILILASNPKGTSVLDLDREIRDIREGLKLSPNRDEFDIEVRGAVRPSDLRRAMLEVKPQIVHFCGHGSGKDGLVLENDQGNEHFVNSDALSKLFKQFSDNVECILLNACYSEVQADALIQHINYVIGMSREIGDEAAIAFSIGFYDSVGAGRTVEVAYELGCNSIQMELSSPSLQSRKLIPIQSPEDRQTLVSPDHLIPVLKKKQNLNTIVASANPPVPTNKSQLEPLIGHSDWIRSLAFSPDGKTILSGSNDKTVRLWDVETGQLLHLLTGHRDRVKGVGISPDRQLLLSCSADGNVKAWDENQLTTKKTGDCRYTIRASSKPITLVHSLPISPDSQRPIFATGAEHGKVSLWRLETGEWIRTFQAHSSPVISLSFSPDGQMLVSGSVNSTIKVWQLNENSNQPLHIIAHAHLSEVLSVAISPDGQTLVSGGADRTIKLWDLTTGMKKISHILEGHAGRVWCVAISPDGTKIASASADYTVKIWDLKTGKILQTFTGHLGEVRAVAFSPNDENLLASGGDDLEIRLWQIQPTDAA